jgi:hypothetical protein
VEYLTSPYTTSPQIEYVSSAPAVEYITSPQIEYVSSAPAVEYLTAPAVEYAAPAVEYVEYIQQPRVLPQTGASRNLLAMGNVVSERVVTIEELYAEGRYEEAPAEMARTPAPMVQTYAQPAIEYVSMAPQVEYVYEDLQPQYVEYVSGAPAVEYEYLTGAPVEYAMGAPAVQYF